MFSFSRLITISALAVSFSESASIILRDTTNTNATDSSADNSTVTDVAAIMAAATQVYQKGGASADAVPYQPVPAPAMTADNGTLVNATIPTSTTSPRDLTRRDSSSDDGYWTVFSGSGSYDPDDTNDHDAAIEGSYYLTYKLVSNDTSVYPQSVEDCFQFCDSVPECVYVNLYYEMNNYLLDWVFSEKSNLKCALYGDVHPASEKTNFGGQQLEPGNTNYIQDSVAYAKSTGPIIGATPSGYTQVGSGPLPGANNAPSYLTFYFLAQFDFNACATLCNNLAADSNGNTCKYFNIWRAVVSDAPVTYTCSLYYDVPDISTADNYGDAQNNLVVTDSYGFAKN